MNDWPDRRAQVSGGTEAGIQSTVKAVVVGAGVSGCACAATLSACGVSVTLMNSALDAVGQPSYGPVVEGGEEGWGRIVTALRALPPALRAAWVEASCAPDTEAPFFVVDRRMLSIETKRALEQMRGLELRQGLASGLQCSAWTPRSDQTRCSDDRRRMRNGVMIETAFGETIDADVVVVAVGMGLGGRVHVGDDVLPGGRYGEASSDGLRISLESLGAVFVERHMQIGPSFSGWSPCGEIVSGQAPHDWTKVLCGNADELVGVVSLRERLEAFHDAWGSEGSPGSLWPDDYPPAPHWDRDLRVGAKFVTSLQGGRVRPWMSPDGVALGEIYRSPGISESEEPNRRVDFSEEGRSWSGLGFGEGSELLGSGGLVEGAGVERGEGGAARDERNNMDGVDGAVASRLGHSVTGLVVRNCDCSGRLVVKGSLDSPIWICGRAGGASDYVDSLVSGVKTGYGVARVVGRSGPAPGRS